MTDIGSKAAGAPMPQAQGLQQSLKLLFLFLTTSYLLAISGRLLLLPAAGAGDSIGLLLPLTLTGLSTTFAWWRLSRPGIIWQAVILLISIAGAASSAILGGAFSLWVVPFIAACCALFVALAGLQEASARPQTWGLTARQWALSALFACAIIGICLVVWFSHEGVEREANVVIRNVRVSLLVLLVWTAAINLRVAGRPARQARKWLFGIFLGALIVGNFVILSLDPFTDQLSSQSVPLAAQLTALPILALAAVVGLAFPRWINSIALAGLLSAVWSQGSILAPTNAVGLGVAGLAGLFIGVQRWPVAAAYWAAVLAGPVIGIGITNPAFVVNAMGATIVFAGSYGLSCILDTYSEQREAEGSAADRAVETGQATEFLDRRSALIGVAAAAVVALIGGALLYMDYSRDRERAHERAQNTAERLAERVQYRLDATQRITSAFAKVELDQVSTHAEFEEAVADMAPLLGEGATLAWSPGGIIRFVEPLQGNEVAIGQDLLQRPDLRSELEHIIATAEPHWTGPFALPGGRRGKGLAYTQPVYEPGAPPSRQSFIGFLGVSVELDQFFNEILKFDARESDVRIWVANSSSQSTPARPLLVWGFQPLTSATPIL